MNRTSYSDLCIFVLLAAFGVLGRWLQPEWNFTPIAATAAFGGFYFARVLPAMLLPISILAVSDIALSTHVSLPVQMSVHLAMLVPVALGRVAQRRGGSFGVAALAAVGFVPATVFFFVTNFAVWLFQSDYALSWTGLASCYTRALPFYRTMLAGDLFYGSVMMASLALCYGWTAVAARQVVAKQL